MIGRCPACGAPVDGDVCDWRCAAQLDAEARAHDCPACHEGCDCDGSERTCDGCSICAPIHLSEGSDDQMQEANR